MIEHFFVLMMENRSFDHMLGFSKIQGIDQTDEPTCIEGLTGNESNLSANGRIVPVSFPAAYVMKHGPGHEFRDVQEQLCGRGEDYSSPAPAPGLIDPKINNSGYVTNYSLYDRKTPEKIMQGYLSQQLPVLVSLAKEFAVCDRWFSSIPGPTWPNRFFVHAASSGGLDDSPRFSRELKSILTEGFSFDNGTIYDCLDNEKLKWAVYCADEFPQVLSLAGMRSHASQNIHPFPQLRKDLNSPEFDVSYVFIEPDYHAFTGNFRGGSSQHPNDDVTRGEKFIKDLYEVIRNSPYWDRSVLIITYDEHGGFYDHVVPPACVDPGDSITDPSNNHNDFDFRQLGVRVPTIVISPLVPKGTIDHTIYDHTSVLATAQELFKLGNLTKRDASANSVNHLFRLSDPREDAPITLPNPAISNCDYNPEKRASLPFRFLGGIITSRLSLVKATRREIDPSLSGFHHIAFLRHLENVPIHEREEEFKRFLRHDRVEAVNFMHRVKEKITSS